MMLGRIVALEPQRLVTYDSERRLGTREGRAGFAENFIIEEYTIEDPQYTYQAVTADGLDISQKPDKDMKGAIGDDFFEQLENIITIPQLCSPFGTQYFYTLADTDKLILYSTLSNQYFLLERDNQNQTQELPSKTGLWRNGSRWRRRRWAMPFCGSILRRMNCWRN